MPRFCRAASLTSFAAAHQKYPNQKIGKSFYPQNRFRRQSPLCLLIPDNASWRCSDGGSSVPSGKAPARFKLSDLADAAETRVSRDCRLRFVGAWADEQRAYHVRRKTFAQSLTKCAAAIDQHDLPDLDGV